MYKYEQNKKKIIFETVLSTCISEEKITCYLCTYINIHIDRNRMSENLYPFFFFFFYMAFKNL